MSIGFANIECEEIIKKCTKIIEPIQKKINVYKAKMNEQIQAEVETIIKKHNWWAFLPLWKPITDCQAKEKQKKQMKAITSMTWYYRYSHNTFYPPDHYYEAIKLITAAKYCKDKTMLVAVGTVIFRE